MRVDLQAVEDAAKDLYIRALKILPDDIKEGFRRLDAAERAPRAKTVLGTMIRNIAVAETEDNLLCQDTGVPIYNVSMGRKLEVDGVDLEAALSSAVNRLGVGPQGLGGDATAFAELGGAYLASIGGTAALETTWIESIEHVDLEDLNPESLWKFRIRGFGPLLVAMDSAGGNLHSEVDAGARAQRAAVLASLGVA